MKGRPNGNRLVPTAFVTGVLGTTMELRGLRRKSCRRLHHLKPEEARCGVGRGIDLYELTRVTQVATMSPQRVAYSGIQSLVPHWVINLQTEPAFQLDNCDPIGECAL